MAQARAAGHLLADEAILGGEQVIRERLLVEDVTELAVEVGPLVVADLQQAVLDAERVFEVLAEVVLRVNLRVQSPRSRPLASVARVAAIPLLQKMPSDPPLRIIDCRNAVSARSPSTSASTSGATG